MKSTGIIRRIDDLGRVVIPKEIRRTLHVQEGDPMEIFVQDGGVFFKKYDTTATFIEYVDRMLHELDYEYDLCSKDKVLSLVKEIKNVLADEQKGKAV